MRTLALCSIVLAGAMVVGCDTKTETKPATPAVPGAPASGSESPKSIGDAITEKAASVSDAAVKEAQTKIEQAITYIKENKLDLAEKALTELDKIKDKLPESIQSQLANAHSMLNAAKSGKGLTLPGGH
ncbi:MAG: hypothetical protein IT447_03695 [Phycisphaerales bacterium]|jgi:hypothetical protein|nr:hypothetical protein [Phycisphaerales bacterium]